MHTRKIASLLLAWGSVTGCAAAVGAAVAAREIRQGFAGVQQLVASSRSLLGQEAGIPEALETPLAGTYRGVQVLGRDTVSFYVRTVARPTAPILDADGQATGYALAGLASTSLDSLEARIGRGNGGGDGSAIFFVEGIRPPDGGARTLYAAAFLGGVPAAESAVADSMRARLLARGADLRAPAPEALSGRGLPHDLFDEVADGVFTLTSDGGAVYEQEVELEGEGELELRFERISATTLPQPEWLPADRLAPGAN